jgi:hypothetical protein
MRVGWTAGGSQLLGSEPGWAFSTWTGFGEASAAAASSAATIIGA